MAEEDDYRDIRILTPKTMVSKIEALNKTLRTFVYPALEIVMESGVPGFRSPVFVMAKLH